MQKKNLRFTFCPKIFKPINIPFLTLELGHPSAENFKGTDLRTDSRIFKALQESGKLYKEVELVVTCNNIVGTGKRRPSFVFTLSVVSVSKGEFAEKKIYSTTH